jgi:hypothetical protein
MLERLMGTARRSIRRANKQYQAAARKQYNEIIQVGLKSSFSGCT